MKYQTTRFKSLEVALKELQPFIRNGEHLQTGKPFKRFGGLRSRELLANWLLCAVVNYDSQAASRLTFTSDPLASALDAQSVSCKNIRLSSNVANPLSRSPNSRADGDGWSVCTLMRVSRVAGLKGMTVAGEH